MSYTLQVIDARNDGSLKKVSGVSSSSAQFLDLLNQVERRLLKRGEFYGTDQTVGFCINSCIVTWPRFVGTILGVRFGCGWHRGGALPYNNWYGFTNNRSAWGGYGNVPASSEVMMGYGRGHLDAIVEDIDPGCTYNDITGTTGKKLVYHIVNPADVGKTITFYGKQFGGQPLQQQVGGVTVMGQSLAAIGGGDAMTPNLITQLTSVTRQATQGMAYLYEFDPDTGLLHDLAVYMPYETNPRYRRSRILNHGSHHSKPDPTTGVCWTNLEAFVKLQHIPLVSDQDFLIIDDFDALKLAIQAVKLEEANESKDAEIKWVEAIRELNMELREKSPDQHTSSRIKVSGHTLRNLQ